MHAYMHLTLKATHACAHVGLQMQQQVQEVVVVRAMHFLKGSFSYNHSCCNIDYSRCVLEKKLESILGQHVQCWHPTRPSTMDFKTSNVSINKR